MKTFKRFTAAVLAAIISAVPVAALADEPSKEYSSYDTVVGYVADMYIDDTLTKEDIMQQGLSKYLEGNDDLLVALLKATLSSLDDYSEFFTADEYTEFENTVNRTFYGLGVTLEQDGEYVSISGFAEENGKAQQSGFMAGDKIVKVNGADVVGWSVTDVRNRIIGEVNTTVNITVLRGGEYIDLIGTRTEVRQNTVSSTVLAGNIGYIKITSFGSNTASEFKTVIDDFNNKGVKNVILDLRNNGGGLLSAAVGIAEMIVPKGKIVEVKYRQEEYNVTYNSKKESVDKDYIVLVNENTASSSEILASAIQDSGAGKLLGEQTFGKAVVQTAVPLNNGSVFKLTIGKYITRNGNEINGIGLSPDYDVKNDRTRIDATRYTKFDFKTKWALGSSGDGIKAAKERLSMMGYYSGNTENNVFYKDLKDAVKAFQLDSGLAPYGVIDIPTQVKLENRFEQLETASDSQLEEAYKLLGGDAQKLYAE